MTFRSRVGAAFVVGLIGGCASVSPPRSTTDVVNDRNYTIGVERSATVGEPMLRIKQYELEKSPYVTPSTACVVSVGFTSRSLAHGEQLHVGGETPCSDGTCRIVDMWPNMFGPVGVVINAAGDLTGRSMRAEGGGILPGTVTAEPKNCKFIAVQGVIAAGTVYRNHELIYSGIDGQTMHFMYREYSADDLAKPAYTQPFSYPLGTQSVRFKDMVIRIADARPDAIRYTVTDDGATKGETPQ